MPTLTSASIQANSTHLTPNVAELKHAYEMRRINAKEVIHTFLGQVERLNPKLNAYVHVDAAGAMDAATHLDRQTKTGAKARSLAGIPVAIKDIIAVGGMPTRAGSRVNVNDLIGSEGHFVRALRDAGCIVLGKTTTVEFALGAGPQFNGTPWNPIDTHVHRIPGGSSSGSAVAVAAGLAAFAVGTDTGGSVRIPASLCGVVGMKPSSGVWPMDGVLPVSPTFDTIGLFARTVEDVSLVFAALNKNKRFQRVEPQDIVLGVPRVFFTEHVTGPVLDTLSVALKTLISAGISIKKIEFDEAFESRKFAPIVPYKFLGILSKERFEAKRGEMDPEVAERIASGYGTSSVDYERIMRHLPRLRAGAAQRFSNVDAIVTPTIPFQAQPLSRFEDPAFAKGYHARVTDKTRVANVLDLVAVTIPVSGKTDLPVGLQIMCNNGEDAKALAIAQMVSRCLAPFSE